MSGHTPGPWVAQAYLNHRGQPTGAASVRSSNGHRIADTVPTADARLIAAAPDLYAALVGLLDSPGDVHDQVMAARVAIAKAEGK